MTNFFKKTLVAAAVATAAMSVSAAEVDFTTFGISVEGAQGLTNFDLGSDLTITLDSEYSVGDIITFTVSGDAADKSKWPASITVPETVLSGTPGTDAKIAKGMTLGRLSGTTGGATYRITAIAPIATAAYDEDTDTTTTIGAEIVLEDGDIGLNATKAVAAGTVVFGFSAQTQTGVALDSKDTVDLSVAGEQIYLDDVTKLNGEIQIQSARKTFASSAVSDSFEVVTAEETKAYRNAGDSGVTFLAATEADVTGVTTVLKGNFGFIPDLDDVDGWVTATTCSIDADDDGSVTATEITATAAAVGTCGIELDVTGGVTSTAPVAIEPQSFKYDVTVAYEDANSVEREVVLASGADAGSWSLNSYSTTIGYMPYGAGISQIIYVANTSTSAGKIFADAWLANGTKVLSNVEVGSLVANGQTEVSTKLAQELAAKGVVTDRVRVRLLAEVPTGNARTFSAYNVNGDRLATGNN